MNIIDEILMYFPNNIYSVLGQEFNKNPIYNNAVQEIRLRANKPIILKFRDFDKVIECFVTPQDIIRILERFCENSIYAYKNQICQGFLTLKGGHRVGITGTVVIEDNKIINIKYISSLNIRIAREVIGCSNNIINEILDLENETIFNTLIVSPPGKGKTTMLRDVVRQISNGIREKNFRGLTVGLVDERGEVSATYKGIAQNDVGIRTDIVGNVDKANGVEMLIRSMAPSVIACDEIGGIQDVQAIERAMLSGVKGIFTMHGKDIADVKNNKAVCQLLENNNIEKTIFI